MGFIGLYRGYLGLYMSYIRWNMGHIVSYRVKYEFILGLEFGFSVESLVHRLGLRLPVVSISKGWVTQLLFSEWEATGNQGDLMMPCLTLGCITALISSLPQHFTRACPDLGIDGDAAREAKEERPAREAKEQGPPPIQHTTLVKLPSEQN